MARFIILSSRWDSFRWWFDGFLPSPLRLYRRARMREACRNIIDWQTL